MGMPGVFELVVILAIVILIFGSKRLKNIGKDLGGAIKGFKKSMDAESSEKTTKNNNKAKTNKTK